MKTKTSPRLVKKDERDASKDRATVKVASDTTTWSTAVRSWVVEFQDRDHGEALQAFDSLFKPALSPTEGAE